MAFSLQTATGRFLRTASGCHTSPCRISPCQFPPNPNRFHQVHERSLNFKFSNHREMSALTPVHPSLEIVSTKPERAPVAIGHYSQAIKSNGLLFVSGTLGLNPFKMTLVEGGIKGQAMQSLKNISSILESGRSSFAQVIKTTVFLKNMDDFDIVNEIYSIYFGPHKPARSTVEVSRLPKDALIEIECIAR